VSSEIPDLCEIGPTLSNQITSISSQGFESYTTHEASGIFEFATVDSTTVLNELEKLNSSKLTGPDNIPVKLLKDSKETVAPFLAYIFNTSLCSGIFPINLRWQEPHQFIKKVIKKKGVIIDRYMFFQLSLNYLRSSYAYS
jgi:hypothetical protein